MSGMLMAGAVCCCGPPTDPSEECVGDGLAHWSVVGFIEWNGWGPFAEPPLGTMKYYYFTHNMYGRRLAGAVVFGGALACLNTGTGATVTRSITYGPESASSGTFTYRYWRAGYAPCPAPINSPDYPGNIPFNDVTTQTITVHNTGSRTITVNGANLAPGFSRTFHGITYVGADTSSHTGYTGGDTVTITVGCVGSSPAASMMAAGIL
jgi:hypothetical protein